MSLWLQIRSSASVISLRSSSLSSCFILSFPLFPFTCTHRHCQPSFLPESLSCCFSGAVSDEHCSLLSSTLPLSCSLGSWVTCGVHSLQIKPCWCLVQEHTGGPAFTRYMWWCPIHLDLSLSWLHHSMGQSKWDADISGTPRKCLPSNSCFPFCLTASVLSLFFSLPVPI